MTVSQVVMEPPTEHQRELARRELARRKALSEAKRGVPMSDQHRRSISEGLKRSWAERREALAAVMREEEVVAAHGLQE